jgi:hypothetical protein
MVLTCKFRAGEVAEIEGFDRSGFYVSVLKGLFPGSYGQRTQILVRERSERRFPRPNNRNLSQYAHFVLLRTYTLRIARKFSYTSGTVQRQSLQKDVDACAVRSNERARPSAG